MSTLTLIPEVPSPSLPAESSAFPTSTEHAHAWAELAKKIAQDEASITDTPQAQTDAPGELIVIGSGIETVGFLLGDEELLRTADDVFFCVADPATVVWIKSMRPDALDLYVLYDDTKVRYTTYMQMTEAILYPVRQGRRVVAIYYGHPGIFVLSTHRSILIARREGHRAVMRPSVSALDCLCADLGVDPCHPGMQTHEATDMLIRGRRPDTNLHVVLWQVGLIGEMGFRRKGYLNANFSILIEYLQQCYGSDYPMTHYVASRYPTIAPLIETHPLSAYHSPAIAARVTGISTVYLAPRDDAKADRAMLERLGMVKPGQEVRTSSTPLREIGKYAPRERKAFKAFRNFSIPKGYHWQADTAGSRFLIALQRDPELQMLYTVSPRQAVEQTCPTASLVERKLLTRRDAGSIQIAAKGTREVANGNRTFYKDLMRKKPLQRSLLRLMASTRGTSLLEALQTWEPTGTYPIDWMRLRLDMEAAQRNNLYPWAGIYRTEASVESRAEHLMVISGDVKKARLWLDGTPVRKFSLRHGILEWQASPGETHHGFLRIDHTARGRRRFVGSIWPQGESVPATYNNAFIEVETSQGQVASVVGYYRNAAQGADLLEIGLGTASGERRTLRATLGGRKLEANLQLEGTTFVAGDRIFPLSLQHSAPPDSDVWRAVQSPSPAYFGSYRLRIGGLASILRLSAEGLLVDGVLPRHILFTRNSVEWSDGPSSAPGGSVSFLLDPTTLHPILFGSVNTAQDSRVTCLAAAPVGSGLRIENPTLVLPESMVDWLTRIATQPSGNVRLLWQMAEKANIGSLLALQVLAKQLP